jgi:hypothetical protein
MGVMKVEKHMQPKDQIKGLTDKQLQESFTKSLTAANPNVSKGTLLFPFIITVDYPNVADLYYII